MEKNRQIKSFFEKEKIDGYIIPKNDEFFCEYIPEHNDRLNFVTGFSGSYGFALILKDKNYLFVDGRYTLQANNQSGKSFKVLTIPEKMPCDILKGKKLFIGFDPHLFTKTNLATLFRKCDCRFKPIYKNLIDEIWKRKIKINKSKFFELPRLSVNENYFAKINKIINYLKKKKSDFLFITASENNAWLLNIRGQDTKYTPIPHSYILINKNKDIKFFCDPKKISFSLKKSLRKIKFFDIKVCDKILSKIKNQKFILDNNSCSYFFENIIQRNNKILNFEDPIYFFKAIKGKQEIKNIKRRTSMMA